MVNITMLCANRPRLLKQALDSIGDLSDATVTIRNAGIAPELDGICRQFGMGKMGNANGGNLLQYWLEKEPLGTGPFGEFACLNEVPQ